MIKLTKDNIQVRFISGASSKIIINSNANWYLKGESYDESIEDKRHNEMIKQILACDGTCQPFDLRPVYSTLERQLKEITNLYGISDILDYGDFLDKIHNVLENKK